MKKLIATILASVMLLSLAACGQKPEATGAATQSQGTEATQSQGTEAAQKYVIGICQLIPHDALDAASQGFMDAVKAELGEENVTFDYQTAAGDSATCSPILNAFVTNEVDLIMANATPALQAAVAATGDIPILGTSVTEYGVALDIDNFSGTVGGNVSGTSDLAPLDQQAAMIKEWFPDAKNVGLLYCSGEANSKYQVDTVEAELVELGYTVKQYAFTDSNDIQNVCMDAADNSDVIYIPTDNTAAAATSVINDVCRDAEVPVIAGEEGICKGCGVATLSISYYDLGYTTGKMAAQILRGEKNISEMPVAYAETFTKKYNATICQELGLTAPEGYVAVEE